MSLLIYIFCTTVRVFLSAIQFAMFLRAILSWFIHDPSNSLIVFLDGVTEPVIHPVRMFLDRFEAVRSFPIDISFFVTYILLSLIQSLLP